MMLAAELAPLRVNWEERDPEKVVLGTSDEKRVPGDYPAIHVWQKR
jgi:hypothetical protein